MPPPTSRDAELPIWLRKPETARRVQLSRDAIVQAALDLADERGPDAVSMRGVAARLGSRPMSLYAHIDSKEDLVALMADRIMGEAILNNVPTDWRDALRAISRATRAVALRHPWLTQIGIGRPLPGPNALRHIEQSLEAVASLPVNVRARLDLLQALDALTIGYGSLDNAPEIAASAGEYLTHIRESANYPRLADVIGQMTGARPNETQFERSLTWLLDGFAHAHGLPED